MKNQNKSNLFKIISINLFSVLFIIVLIELIFGYWFDKDNFGPFMREHRNKNNSYTLKYKGEVYEYVYDGLNNVRELKQLNFSDEEHGPDFVEYYFDSSPTPYLCNAPYQAICLCALPPLI